MLRAVAISSAESIGAIPESEKGQPNGVATLDGTGKIPTSEMPVGDVTYRGNWNAATNTPTLANGVGTAGDLYICDVGGTRNLGGGSVVYAVGDWLIYDGAVWDRVGATAVTSGDPSALVGLTAINGVAPTFMRSDAAPALNQAITPTWTGAHIFNQKITFAAAKNYEVLAINIASDDRLVFRAATALAARFWFDSATGSTGHSFAEGGTERAYLGTAIGGNVVLDARTTYGLQIMTQSVVRAAFDTSGNLAFTVPSFRINAGGANNAVLNTALLTAERIFQFPDAAGTLAIRSDFASGGYAPTLTPGANVANASANGQFTFMRVGTSILVSGSIDITATAPGASVLQVTMPVPVTFSDTHKLSGSGAATNGTVMTPAYVRSNSGQQTAIIDWVAPNTQSNSLRFTALYTTL